MTELLTNNRKLSTKDWDTFFPERPFYKELAVANLDKYSEDEFFDFCWQVEDALGDCEVSKILFASSFPQFIESVGKEKAYEMFKALENDDSNKKNNIFLNLKEYWSQ
jgi:hypothetical protein